MQDLCTDLLDEHVDLAALLSGMDAGQWHITTSFHGWTPWDEVAHLCYFDEAALQSIHAPADFAREARALRERVDAEEAISAIARKHYGALDGPALLARWRSVHESIIAALRQCDATSRLAWYGPPMGVRSFASARLMEIWAHGQDVWDALERRRTMSARLRHIAHMGVQTYEWTFVNRGLPVPRQRPFVELQGPTGVVWHWGDEAAVQRISGTAEDFCLVATQRRNVADTGLRCEGDDVARWASMAQCFAGPPADPPRPGERQTQGASVLPA